ncbi:MAG: hypothetical protein U5M23_14680, partial [Marinagarivorans sp.]|nr:hypothetical protein [Marinagarivorans sp.]
MTIARVLLGASAYFFSGVAASGDVSTYLPVNINPSLERDIERLVVLGNIPNLTKPYSVAVVVRQLETIKNNYPKLYQRLNDGLQPYQSSAGLTHLRATLSDSDDSVAKPNAQGRTTEESIGVSVRGYWQPNGWVALSAGGELTNEQLQVSGSLISLGRSWAQLDIGYKELWLSPFNSSAQMLSAQAQTLPSISLGASAPIEFWLLGVSYAFSVAQMSRQPTLYRDVYSDNKGPLLASVVLQLHP